MDTPRVVSLDATNSEGKAVKFTVSTDLVDYMESARAFGRDDLAAEDSQYKFQRRLIAIPDRKTSTVTSMVLTINNLNGLYLVRKDEGAANNGGWRLIDLDEAFKKAVGNSPKVRAMGAAWTDDDKITLAVAVDNGTAGAASRVFVAYNLSSKTSDWDNISWTDCGTRGNIQVKGIRVLDEGSGVWTVVLAGDKGPNDSLYLLKSNGQQAFSKAFVFNPAVTMNETLDFEVAVHPILKGGVALLGISGTTRVLSFRAFPKYDSQGNITSTPPVAPLPCPTGANVLEATSTRNKQTDLYIGGQGVHLITGLELAKSQSAKVVQIISPDLAKDVQDLVIADAKNGSISAAALLRSGELKIVKRASSTANWGTPLRLRQKVQEIAPVEGDQYVSTSLFAVYTDGKAGILWQDAQNGVWQERQLVVANPTDVQTLSCYGTSVRLLNSAGTPQPGVKVSVSASLLSSLLVNNNSVFVGPGLTFETETDNNGTVSIFDRVRSLTPAIYRFTFDKIPESLDINPAGGIHERFQTMTADDVRNATVSSNNGTKTPLLAESYRTGSKRSQVDALASSLNQVSKLSNSTNGTSAGVRKVDSKSAFSSKLQTQSVPGNYRWGIQADSKGVRSVSSSVMDNLVKAANNPGDYFKDLGDTIGDFFEGLYDKHLKDGWTFVLNKIESSKAFEFICSIGNSIKRWTLDRWEELSSFATWLWNQIEIGWEKLVSWLKFVFNWEDILKTRRFLADITDESFNYLLKNLEKVKGNINSSFDNLEKMVAGWRGEIPTKPTKLRTSTEKGFNNTAHKAMDAVDDVLDKVMNNSGMSWASNQVDKILNEIIQVTIPDSCNEYLNKIGDSMLTTFSNQATNLLKAYDQVAADVSALFGGNAPSPEELTMDTFKDIAVSVGTAALTLLLNTIRDMIILLVDLLEGAIAILKTLLYAKVRLPFIENLIKEVTFGLASVDTSFRLIDAILLLPAILTTIGVKIVTNDFPLKKGVKHTLPFGNTVTVQSESDLVRTLKVVAGLGSSWVSWIITMYQVFSKLDTVSSKKPITPSSNDIKWVSVTFSGLSLCRDVYHMHHDTDSETVQKLEWATIACSAAVLLKNIVYIKYYRTPANAQESDKISSVIDIIGYVVTLGLKSGAFAVLPMESDEKTYENLLFSNTVFDRFGSILNSLASVFDNPKIKIALLGGSSVSKFIALGVDFGVVASIPDSD